MKPSRIELRRDALYDLVWKTPICRLAKTYGLSDNGLRKACKKLHVPTPPRGYWAKLRHGYDVSPATLPTLPEDAPDVHVIYRGTVEREEAGGVQKSTDRIVSPQSSMCPRLRYHRVFARRTHSSCRRGTASIAPLPISSDGSSREVGFTLPSIRPVHAARSGSWMRC